MCIKISPLPLYNVAKAQHSLTKVLLIESQHWDSMRGETKNCQNRSFSHNFCHWLSHKVRKVSSVVFYCWLFWITLKACDCPLCHYGISLNKFWSPNKQYKCLGKQDKIFIYQIFFSGKNKLKALERRLH